MSNAATLTTVSTVGTVPPPLPAQGNVVVRWITTTDHKTIGYLYLITSFLYFCIGGVLALVMRAELFTPGLDIVQSNEQYNQLFTMHGTIHADAVRDTAVRRFRERGDATADRRPRRRLPVQLAIAAQH